MADAVVPAKTFSEPDFQRWVVTAPWFDDLAASRGLDTDELKARLAKQIFSDTEYDFRGMYTHDLMPTMNGDNIVLPRSNGNGLSFLSPDAQIGDFFNTRFGVPQAFFGADTESALRNASALGLLPGYAVPGGGEDRPGVDRTATYSDSLKDYSASNPVTGTNYGPSADPTNPISIDLSDIGFDPSRIGFEKGQMFSRDNIFKEGINFAAGLAGNALAGPLGGAIASGAAQYGQGRSALGTTGSVLGGLVGGAFGGPPGALVASYFGGLIGDKFGAPAPSPYAGIGGFSGYAGGLDPRDNVGGNYVGDAATDAPGGSFGGGWDTTERGPGYNDNTPTGPTDQGGYSGGYSSGKNDDSDHNSTPGW